MSIVVCRADRVHGQIHARPVGGEKAVGDLVNRPVATGRPDHRVTPACCLKRQFLGMTGSFSRFEIGAVAQDAAQAVQPARRPAAPGRGVINHANLSRAQGNLPRSRPRTDVRCCCLDYGGRLAGL